MGLICTFLLIPLVGFSQAGIEVSPYRIEENVEPGDTVTRTVRVTNTSDRERTFYADLMDFTVVGEGGNVRLMRRGENEGRFLTDWVDIGTAGMHFEPGESREVNIIFEIPEDVGPGAYHGAVVFGPSPPSEEDIDGSFLGLTHQVGVLALFNVVGDVDVDARIREFSTDQLIYDAPFEARFLSRVENTGNLHIKPMGSIIIKNMRGSEVANIPLNRDGFNALPGRIRRLEAGWADDFGFGPYTAHLTLSFGESTRRGGTGIRTTFDETSFWVVPRGLLLRIAGVLVFVLLVLYLIFKQYQKKAIEEIMEETGLSRKKAIEKKGSPGIYFVISALVIIGVVLALGIYIYMFIT